MGVAPFSGDASGLLTSGVDGDAASGDSTGDASGELSCAKTGAMRLLVPINAAIMSAEKALRMDEMRIRFLLSYPCAPCVQRPHGITLSPREQPPKMKP